MPIIDIQRRLREAGRIRLGVKVPMSGGKTRPGKIESFRFTSGDERAIKEIANLYGGEVTKWDDAPVGDQWQVTTESTSLDVIVPPVDLSFTQWMETWSGGGCTKRCDGQTNVLTDKPCSCDPDNPTCKPTTRLGVIIMALQGIGVWRLETHGWNSAQELTGTIEVLRSVQSRGAMIPARLMLDQRQAKKDGKTHNFVVPVLDLQLSVAALTNGASVGPQLGSNVTPVPRELDSVPSVADQLAAVDDPSRLRSPRANAAATLPSTGLAPRPVIDATSTLADDVSTQAAAEAVIGEAFGVSDAAPEKPKPSAQSLRGLFATINGNKALPKDDEGRHAWASAMLKRPITTFNDLSPAEIKALKDIAKKVVGAESAGGYDPDDPERPF